LEAVAVRRSRAPVILAVAAAAVIAGVFLLVRHTKAAAAARAGQPATPQGYSLGALGIQSASMQSPYATPPISPGGYSLVPQGIDYTAGYRNAVNWGTIPTS
jgi:hypothetical protein